jgi:hypothetical protein
MEAVYLGETEIMISGLLVEVFLWRNSVGNIQWIPADEDIFAEGGFLEGGHVVDGYQDQIIISKYQ